MKERRLGRTNLLVPEIGLGGAWLLGRQGDQPVSHGTSIIRRALDLGVNYIDTAECYIEGRSEYVVGTALEGETRKPILATKFGHRPATFDLSRQSVVESARESLRRLQRPAVDVFQLHTPAEPPWERIVGPGGALEGMQEVRERGWCRWIGISGRDIEFLRRCIATDAFDTVLIFQRFDLLDQSAESLFAEAKAHDMGVILGSPLRMGLFGSAYAEMFPRLTVAERARVAKLQELFASEPDGMTGAAIRFALSHPVVSVVLSGAASPAEIEGAIRAAARPLTSEQVAAVRRIGS